MSRQFGPGLAASGPHAASRRLDDDVILKGGSGRSSGHISTARAAAATIGAASISALVSATPSAGQARTNVSGPGGGSGHNHISARDTWPSPDPAARPQDRPLGSLQRRLHLTGALTTTFRPPASRRPTRAPSGSAGPKNSGVSTNCERRWTLIPKLSPDGNTSASATQIARSGRRTRTTSKCDGGRDHILGRRDPHRRPVVRRRSRRRLWLIEEAHRPSIAPARALVTTPPRDAEAAASSKRGPRDGIAS
jgi:hypothetical protein